ncbi:MAG: hypothetical protein IAE89_07685 [Anaerolineae bacterium]|nr:hypothetical protein [Anaerolineae bacterium]
MAAGLSFIFTLFIFLCFSLPTSAQSTSPVPHEIFITQGASSELHFINLLTGAQSSVTVNGDNFLVTPEGLLFVDESGEVQQINERGDIKPHPFISLPPEIRRLDWISTGDQIAWTITVGTPNSLITETWVAHLNGENKRVVFRDGPRDGIRAYPVTFSSDGETLFMDYQPHTIADITPFQQYAALFSLNLDTGDTVSLPGEAACYCGGDIRDGQFMRMVLGSGGFDIRAYDLANGSLHVLTGLERPGFTLGGDLTIAPGGSRAIYALAQLSADNIETIFVLADVASGTVQQLGEATAEPLRPIGWTDDGEALLLRSRIQDGTWRLDVKTGEITQIAQATYLGAMLAG